MSAGFGEEPLSLGTFDPAHAQPPYLNTPRSLEACRRFGINPIELVEVSIDEFRKDLPDDPDGAQRRFERIDGARRRMMTNVMTEWKCLVDADWKPGPKKRPTSAKETILKVRPEAHSQLLELQAEKFRKMEIASFNEMQRMLTITIQKADMEVKNNAIIQQHMEAKQASNEHAKLMQEKRAALLQKQLEERNQKEAEELQRIKELQIEEAKISRAKIAEKEKRLQKEKEGRERREAERLQRERMTKELKASIVAGMNAKADAKKKLQDMKTAESNARKQEQEEERKKNEAKRRRELEKRQELARAEALKKAEEERQKMLDSLQADDMKRQRLFELAELKRKEKLDLASKQDAEKTSEIERIKTAVVTEKAEKTLQELRFKEQLAKQELEKVAQAKEKRLQLKAIRQEAYDLSAMRQRKADEYKVQVAKEAIKIKDDKCQAIRDGFQTLEFMRNKMKDIMGRTKVALKHEIHQLQHKGILSPDKVVAKALEVAQGSLFPKLKHTFGLLEPTEAAEQARINATIGDFDTVRAGTAPAGSLDEGAPETQLHKKQSEKLLPIQYMNKSRLSSTLSNAKLKIEVADEKEAERKTSPPRSRSASPKSHKRTPHAKGPESRTPGSPDQADHKNLRKFEQSERPLKEFPYGEETPKTRKTPNEGIRSSKSTYNEVDEGKFRKEYSADHPLAGGTGKYKAEEKMGLEKMSVKRMSAPAPKGTMSSKQASATIEKLSLQSQHGIVDPEKQLEQLRREQNEALMRVLEEEKANEEERERMSRTVLTEQEAERMELVFAEERRRASERIVKLTKEHEKRTKEAVLAMMSLKKHKATSAL